MSRHICRREPCVVVCVEGYNRKDKYVTVNLNLDRIFHSFIFLLSVNRKLSMNNQRFRLLNLLLIIIKKKMFFSNNEK